MLTVRMIYVQKFKIIIDKEDECKNMRQRNVATKYNINNTIEGHNNHDLRLTHSDNYCLDQDFEVCAIHLNSL
jgi:hypothetical protein